MSQFEVFLPGVDSLSAQVKLAGSDAQSAAGQLRANACIATGNSSLDGALSDFQQFWDSFTQASVADVDTTAATIAAAAAAYQQVDTSVMPDPFGPPRPGGGR